MFSWLSGDGIEYKELYQAILPKMRYQDDLIDQLRKRIDELIAEKEAILADLKQAREDKYDARSVVGLLRGSRTTAIRELEQIIASLKKEYKLNDEKRY